MVTFTENSPLVAYWTRPLDDTLNAVFWVCPALSVLPRLTLPNGLFPPCVMNWMWGVLAFGVFNSSIVVTSTVIHCPASAFMDVGCQVLAPSSDARTVNVAVRGDRDAAVGDAFAW